MHRLHLDPAQPPRTPFLLPPAFGASLTRPRDTAARKSRETGVSSGSVRLSDQGFQGRFRAMAERPGRVQAPDTERFSGKGHGEPGQDRWTTRGSKARTERHRTGAARIQPTASGFARGRRRQGPEPQWPSPNPDLVGGREYRLDRVPVPSLNSGPGFSEQRLGRGFPSLASPPALVWGHAPSHDSFRRQPPPRSRGWRRRDRNRSGLLR